MLEKTTVNALGTGWVDNIPGAVSTGYQAQNVSSEAVRLGLDTIVINAGVGGIDFSVEEGGTVEENGMLWTVRTDSMTIPEAGTAKGNYYFALKEDSGNRSIEMITAATFALGSFQSTKNGYYTADNRRILNTYCTKLSSSVYAYVMFKLESPKIAYRKNVPVNDGTELVDMNDVTRFRHNSSGQKEYDVSSLLTGKTVVAGAGVSCSVSQFHFLVLDGSDYQVASYNFSTNAMTFKSLYKQAATTDIEKPCGVTWGEDIAQGKQIFAVTCDGNEVGSAKRIYLFDINGSSVAYAAIDTTAISPVFDLDYRDGNFWSTNGTAVRKHTGLSATVSQSYSLSYATASLVALPTTNEIVCPLYLNESTYPFYQYVFPYNRTIQGFCSITNYFSFWNYNAGVIAYHEWTGVLMSFDHVNKKILVQ